MIIVMKTLPTEYVNVYNYRVVCCLHRNSVELYTVASLQWIYPLDTIGSVLASSYSGLSNSCLCDLEIIILLLEAMLHCS